MNIEKQIIKQKQTNWLDEKKSEYDLLKLDIDFNDWLNELEQYKVTTTDKDGKEVVNTYSRKLRPMPSFTASQIEIDAVYKSTPEYKTEQLSKLDITTISNGLQFYTDDKSLLDLISADREAERLGALDEDMTVWKTPDGMKQVTIKDIRDAIAKRLSNKAKIVGVI